MLLIASISLFLFNSRNVEGNISFINMLFYRALSRRAFIPRGFYIRGRPDNMSLFTILQNGLLGLFRIYYYFNKFDLIERGND